MPFEQARQKLMSQTVDWGAPPPTLHIPSATGSPESGTTAPLLFTSVHNAPTTTNMEYVVEEQPHQKTFVSSKDWTVDALLERGPRFHKIDRVSATGPLPNLLSAIETHERSGLPLIIEGWHKHKGWPKDIFTVDWFRERGQQEAKARNVHDWTDINISIDELIHKQRTISTSIIPGETERLYGKDAHCPEAWTKWLNESGVIPQCLLPESSDNLLQCVPEKERVETLMCYLGIGDTFTPCHKDLCASSGQNIMCYTENGGSSFWFMTESSSAPAAADYFHELGQELDLETHVVTVEELQKAPFTVYIAEQKLGDMVLVPPRSCHQVVNHGGITIKTSWSRMTLDGLTTAFYHELPIYRRVCRTETYRVKYTIYHTLLRCTRELQKYISLPSSSTTHDSRLPVSSSRNERLPLSNSKSHDKHRLEKTLRRLIDLFDDVLVEDFCKDHDQMQHMTTHSASVDSSNELSNGSMLPTTEEDISRVTCDFCDTDIFQSFFECHKCVASPADVMDTQSAHEPRGDGLVICPSCYVEGRTCRCEIMHPMQCRPFSELLRDRNKAMKVLEQSEVGKGQTHKHAVLGEGNILSEQRLSVFEAACAMYNYCQNNRQNSPSDSRKITRVCTRGRDTHVALRNSQLRCKKCHSSLCFDHILQSGVHSAEAILVYQLDSSNVRWHDRHRDRLLFIQARSQVVQAEKDGGRCDVRHKMAITANNFNTCMPTNSKYTKPGWYDKFVQSSNIPIEDSEKQAIEDIVDDAVNSEVTNSPLTELSSLTPSPTFYNSALPGVDVETSSSSDTEERPPLSLGNEMHMSVRPTSMATILPGMSYVLEPPSNSQQDPFVADVLAINSVPEKKRKREILDYIWIPPLSKAAQSSSTTNSKKTREPATSRAKGNRKREERNASPSLDVEMLPSSYHAEPSPKDVPPSLDRPVRSLPKGTPLKARSKRVVISSRESTPDAVAAPAITRFSDEDGPPMKKSRFREGPPGLRVGEMAVSSTSTSRKHKVDTTPTTGAQRSGAASISETSANAPDTVMRRSDHMYRNDRHGRQPVSIGRTPEEGIARAAIHSFVDKPLRSSGVPGPSNPPSAPLNASVSQAVGHPPRPIRIMDKKFDALEKRFDQYEERMEKHVNGLMKQKKTNERKIQKLENQVEFLTDQLQRFESRQEVYTSQIPKIQRDISSLREDTEQQISRVHQQSSDMRTDMGEIRSRVTENAQINANPATSTHILVPAESLSRFWNTAGMHNNGGQQFGNKFKTHRNNNQSHRQFNPPPVNFEGRHHHSGPSRFRREDNVRDSNDGRYMSQHPSRPPQNYFHGNGNKYVMDTSDRPPSDQPSQFNQHRRVPTPDSSRQPCVGPQPFVRKRYWGPPHSNQPVSGANSIKISPTVPSLDNAENREHSHAADSVHSPESSPPLSTSPPQERVRSRSPNDFWEDDYERDEDPGPAIRKNFLRDTQFQIRPTHAPSAPALAPSEGSITVGGPVEQNPWATPPR